MAFIIKFVYSFPLSFTGKLIITEERKSSHLVALFFHVLEPRTLLELFYSIMWDFFFQKIFWETCDFRKNNFLSCLSWLNTVPSTYIWMGRYNHSLSLDSTIMVSKNWSVIGEHVVIIFLTQ